MCFFRKARAAQGVLQVALLCAVGGCLLGCCTWGPEIDSEADDAALRALAVEAIESADDFWFTEDVPRDLTAAVESFPRPLLSRWPQWHAGSHSNGVTLDFLDGPEMVVPVRRGKPGRGAVRVIRFYSTAPGPPGHARRRQMRVYVDRVKREEFEGEVLVEECTRYGPTFLALPQAEGAYPYGTASQ